MCKQGVQLIEYLISLKLQVNRVALIFEQPLKRCTYPSLLKWKIVPHQVCWKLYPAYFACNVNIYKHVRVGDYTAH